MSEIRILPVLALVIGLLLPVAVNAQVPVEVSNEKMIYGGKVYRMHEVQKNQTLYSISRAYKVTIPEIERENVIPSSGIQAGQVLRIPSREDLADSGSPSRAVEQPSSRPSQHVTSGAGPSFDPATGIRISGEKIVYSGKNYYMHEVLKGQTLYSIAKAYRVTILDIDRENMIPAGGIQAGQVLRIPVASSMVAQEEVAAPPANVRTRTAAAGNRPASTPETAQPAQVNAESKETPGNRTQPVAGQDPSVTGYQAAPTTQAGTAAKQPETSSQDASAVKQSGATTRPDDAGNQTETVAQGPEATPKPEARKAPPEKKKIHKVQKGESLADIAKKYGLSVQELKQANKGVIFAMPDMRLVIPVTENQMPDNQ